MTATDDQIRCLARDAVIENALSDFSRKVPRKYREATASDGAVRAWAAGLVKDAHILWRNDPRDTGKITQGSSLLLLGPTGTGKTWQAYGAIRSIAESGRACRWEATSAADLYADMRPGGNPLTSREVFDYYARADLLVLDDLGVGKQSDWTEEVNSRLFDYRCQWEKPTIITSNLGTKELTKVFGERVTSRLEEMTGSPVVLGGSDRRRKS